MNRAIGAVLGIVIAAVAVDAQAPTPQLGAGARVRIWTKSTNGQHEGRVAAMSTDSVTTVVKVRLRGSGWANQRWALPWNDVDSVQMRIRRPGYVERRPGRGAGLGAVVALALAAAVAADGCDSQGFGPCGPEGGVLTALLLTPTFALAGWIGGKVIALLDGPPTAWVRVAVP